MDNQHKKIKGYRDLSQAEIDLMNSIKMRAAATGDLILLLESQTYPIGGGQGTQMADQRWLAIAKTQLQQGFMALVRSVAKQETF